MKHWNSKRKAKLWKSTIGEFLIDADPGLPIVDDAKKRLAGLRE
jgi:hypothetical protein